MSRSQRPITLGHLFQKLAVKLGREYVIVEMSELSPDTVKLIVRDLQRMTYQMEKAGTKAKQFVEILKDQGAPIGEKK